MSEINHPSQEEEKQSPAVPAQSESSESSVDDSYRLHNLSFAEIVLLSAIFLALIFVGSAVLVSLYSNEGKLPAIPENIWLPILITGLAAVAILSLALAFWAIYMRSAYLKDGPALVPEKWGRTIDELKQSSSARHVEFQKTLDEVHASVQQSTGVQREEAEKLLESFLTLQQALNNRDEEIARLKKGYDAKVFSRFLRRFIRVDRALRKKEHEASDEEAKKNYRSLRAIMEDALEECGVTEFVPEEGANYLKSGAAVADNPREIEADAEEQDYLIAEIVSPGYILEGEGETETLVPARVAIYRYRPSRTEEH